MSNNSVANKRSELATEVAKPDPDPKTLIAKADALAQDKRGTNENFLKAVGCGIYIIVLIAAVWGGLAASRVKDSHGKYHFRFPWHIEVDPSRRALITAIILVVGLLAALSLLRRNDGGLRRLLIGSDGRFSTSQTQAALWTLAIVFVLTCLLMRRPLGASQDTFAKQFSTLDSAYLLLLGGPFAAWVVARKATSMKVDNLTLQKVQAEEAQLKDITSNDDGRGDLTDTQFFVFSMLALIWFSATFARDPSGIPSLPTGLAALTGAASLVFIGNKTLAANAPVISSVTRKDGSGGVRPGDTIVIQGANFVPEGAGGDLDKLVRLTVKFDDWEVAVLPLLDKSGTLSAASAVRSTVRNPLTDRIEVAVPLDITGGTTTQVRVVTAAGVESAAYALPIVVEKPVVTGVVPQPLPKSGEVIIRGRFFRPAQFPAAPLVFLDDQPATVVDEGDDTSVKVETPATFTAATVVVVVESSAGVKSDAVRVRT